MNDQDPQKPRRKAAPPALAPVVRPDLDTALEELRVADEEVRVQNAELVEARAALENEQARYRDLFEFAPDAYFVTTPAGVIREANRAAARLLNIAFSFLPGKPFVTFVAPESRAAFRETLHSLSARSGNGDHVADWELRLLPRRASNPLVAALTVGSIRDANERIAGLRWLARDISDRVRAEQARADLLRRIVSAQEDERRRIARELHDGTGQHLTALSLGLKSLEAASWGRAETLALIQHLRGIADQLGRDTHHLARDLRPTALDDLGLGTALASHAEEWSRRYAIEVDFHTCGLDDERLPAPLETALYRAVQEALTNVARHAHGARRVSVILERRDACVRAIVEDDGAGFRARGSGGNGGGVPAGEGGNSGTSDKGAARPRLGLLGMKERMALVGGTLAIESSPGHGTTVFMRVPLSAPEKPAAAKEAR